jgi:thiol-disulfide isomerase/thioredoxin
MALPSFEGATGWLNSPPLSRADLQKKVVLTDFWTYTCINWLRTEPYIRAWADKYADQGLVTIGVHTPEFSFEHDVDNVRRAVKDMNIHYPVAIDSDYAVWNAFDNHYWPALYLADAEGRIQHRRFGEGGYEEAERAIQQLLGVGGELVSVEGTGLEAPADWDQLESPENYLGYDRGERFASPEGDALDERRVYTTPAWLRTNHWALAGDWTIERECVRSNEAGGSLTYRFHARDLHLVLAPPTPASSVRFRVLLDGRPPGDAHGGDVDFEGNGLVNEPRLYQLIRQRGRFDDRTFEITFPDPNVRVYVFTFG